MWPLRSRCSPSAQAASPPAHALMQTSAKAPSGSLHWHKVCRSVHEPQQVFPVGAGEALPGISLSARLAAWLWMRIRALRYLPRLQLSCSRPLIDTKIFFYTLNMITKPNVSHTTNCLAAISLLVLHLVSPAAAVHIVASYCELTSKLFHKKSSLLILNSKKIHCAVVYGHNELLKAFRVLSES